jgi:hypothetical protein
VQQKRRLPKSTVAEKKEVKSKNLRRINWKIGDGKPRGGE